MAFPFNAGTLEYVRQRSCDASAAKRSGGASAGVGPPASRTSSSRDGPLYIRSGSISAYPVPALISGLASGNGPATRAAARSGATHAAGRHSIYLGLLWLKAATAERTRATRWAPTRLSSRSNRLAPTLHMRCHRPTKEMRKAEPWAYCSPALRRPSRNFAIAPGVYGTLRSIQAIELSGCNSCSCARAAPASSIRPAWARLAR